MTRVNELTATQYQAVTERPESHPAGPKRTPVDPSRGVSGNVNAMPSKSQVDQKNSQMLEGELDGEQLQNLIRELNQHLRERSLPNHDVNLALKGEDRNTFVIEVRDNGSDKVIAQFPPDHLLNFGSRIQEIGGMIVDLKS